MEVIYHHKNGGEEENKKKKKKRRSRAMHVINVVLYMLHRKRRKSLDTGFWRRLMESIHPGVKPYEITRMPPPPSLPPPPLVDKDGHGRDRDHRAEELSEVEETFTAVASSSSMSSSTRSTVSRSQYGSVQSLHEMDMYGDEDDEDDDDNDDGGGGDEMIDMKAEEFIVRFYAQMKMQNQAYVDRCNARRIQKNQRNEKNHA